MTRRLAIFDMDGTLVDSQADIVASMTEAFQNCGMAVPDRTAILGIVGLSLPVALGRLLPGSEAATVEALVAAYRMAYFRRAAEGAPPLYPGVAAMLAALAGRDDVLLGIATGKSRRGLESVLAAHGLRGLFVTTHTADDHPSKPHPAMLLAALAETGVAAPRAAMIGDTSFDIDMARNAGMGALGVSWGYHPAAALAHADAVVDAADEIAAALDRIWAA